MTSHRRGGSVTIRVARGQRASLLIGAGILTALGVAVVWHASPADKTAMWILAGGPFLACALACLILQGARTILSPKGICAWWLVYRRSCRWAAVVDIDLKTKSSARGTSVFVRVHKENGGRFLLPAPMDSSNGRYPCFENRVEEIRKYWANTAPPGAHTPTIPQQSASADIGLPSHQEAALADIDETTQSRAEPEV